MLLGCTMPAPSRLSCSLALLFLAYIALVTSSPIVQRLTGHQQIWILTNVNQSIRVPTRLPGYVLDALQQHGVIGDPLYR